MCTTKHFLRQTLRVNFAFLTWRGPASSEWGVIAWCRKRQESWCRSPSTKALSSLRRGRLRPADVPFEPLPGAIMFIVYHETHLEKYLENTFTAKHIFNLYHETHLMFILYHETHLTLRLKFELLTWRGDGAEM